MSLPPDAKAEPTAGSQTAPRPGGRLAGLRVGLPKGLRGRLILLLLGALVVAQVATTLLLLDERRRAVEATSAGDAASRVLNLARVMDGAPPGRRPRLLEAAQSTLMRFAVTDRPEALRDGVRPLDRLAGRLGRFLGDDGRDLRIAVDTPPDGRPDRRPDSQDGRPRHGRGGWHDAERAELLLSAELADGRWLNATVTLRRPPLQWAWPALASFTVTAALVVAVVWLSAGAIARPMRRLAEAADRLGRGDRPEPLPADGPAEMAHLTEAFNDMAERLTRLLDERSRMLAAIGHDLRSPLTAMRLRLELVDDDETRDRLAICVDEIQSLVESALALARGTGTDEPRQRTDLRALLADLVAELTEAGGAAQLTAPVQLTAPAPVMAEIRPAALRRALRNLAENALRYGGAARIALNSEDGSARITIDDDGPGIPPAQRDRVFEPFVRLEASRSRDTGGAGLGLSIARAAIEAQGGTVRLQDAPGGGARAIVDLPVA